MNAEAWRSGRDWIARQVSGARAAVLEVPRGAIAGLGAFLIAGVVGDILRPGFDATWLVIGGGGLGPLRSLLLLALGVVLISHALAPLVTVRARRAAAAVTLAAALIALHDAAAFYDVLRSGRIESPAILPSSLLLAAALLLTTWRLGRPPSRDFTCHNCHRGARRGDAGAVASCGMCRPDSSGGRSGWVGFLSGAGGFAVGLPVLLMLTFGPTSYARPADCAVVLGARAYADGRCSLALADRVDEAVRLYRRGLVGEIIMSGGIDPRHGGSEAVAMRDRAIAAGVPAAAIVLDEAGDDSAATVRNAAAIMRARGHASALVVSHYYHQPRLKMLFARAGVPAYTVPATMSRRLAKEPWFLFREAAAFYAALLRDEV